MIIVTGASKGIGREVVLSLVRDHATRVLAISRDKLGLDTLRQAAGAEMLKTLALDLAEQASWKKVKDEVGTQRLHGLVNNAGLFIKRPFGSWSAEDFDRLFRMNATAPFQLAQILADNLDGVPPGHVVNISSMGGFQGSVKFPGLVGYSASKAALANITECLAVEWKDRGIRCNCLALGAVDTEMLQAAFPDYRAPVNAQEMARFIARFTLEGHHQFNGKILPVSLSTP